MTTEHKPHISQDEAPRFKVWGRGDYRTLRIYFQRPVTPLQVWGLDIFWWHVPLLKLLLILALVGWWL